MDDFEYAVESQTLPSFLKQDQDYGSSSSNTASAEGGAGGGTVGQSELERLMREMSESDIDALAAHFEVEDTGKVGLMVPEGTEPVQKGVKDGAKEEEEELESVGVKGTVEVVENPDLELEKKMAEVEIGGKLESNVEPASKGLGEEVVETLKKVEETVVGADEGVGAANKEKID